MQTIENKQNICDRSKFIKKATNRTNCAKIRIWIYVIDKYIIERIWWKLCIQKIANILRYTFRCFQQLASKSNN